MPVSPVRLWPSAQRQPLAQTTFSASGSGSVVEHLLAKERVVGSNPIFRSNSLFRRLRLITALPYGGKRLVDKADTSVLY